MSDLITPEILNEFRNNGAVCLRNVFSQYWIDKVIEGIEYNLNNESKIVQRLSNDGDSGIFFSDGFNWNINSALKQFIFESPAAEIAAALMESDNAVLFHDHVLVKYMGTTKETPWHQDQPYYSFDGNKVCSIWMPVDYVPEETCVQYAKRSHLDEKFYIPKTFDSNINYNTETNGTPERTYYDTPDKDEIYSSYEILKYELNPGDCVVFHMRTLHGAPGNLSKTNSRRVLSTRWFGDDVVMVKRPWTTIPGLVTGGLNEGQSVLESDELPHVWNRTSGRSQIKSHYNFIRPDMPTQ